MKINLFVSAVLLLSACSEPQRLDGVWISAYQIHHSRTAPAVAPMNSLLDFEGDQVTTKVFTDPQEEETFQYRIEGNRFILMHHDKMLEEHPIKLISADSIVFETFNGYERDVVFKKLKPSQLNSEVSFTNKAFSLMGEGLLDSIDFVNDSVSFYIGSEAMRTTQHWSLARHKDCQLLIIGNSRKAAYLIASANDGRIQLQHYYDRLYSLEMAPIQKKQAIDDIYGMWIPTEKGSTGLGLHISELFIEKDKLTTASLIDKEKRIYGWVPNSTNEFLCVFSKSTEGDYWRSWKIEKLSKNELVLQLRGHEPTTMAFVKK